MKKLWEGKLKDHRAYNWVFPTGVGMNRLFHRLESLFHSVPHRRGDEPGVEWRKKER